MARPSKISIATVKRNQRFRGPGLSAQQNDMQDELIRDITEIQFEHNTFMVPLLSILPDGTDDPNIDAFRNGLDAQTIYVHSQAVNNAALSRYYNLTKGRPNTIFDQFQDSYQYVDASINTLEETILAAAVSGGLTTAQKERIGLNVFDETLTSSAGSIDEKTNTNELNIVQLARDMYGPAYVSFTIDGTAILANSVRAMTDALLELHNGNWDDDVGLIHSLDASEVTTGTFLQNRVGPSSTAPGGVNDSFVGSPTNLVEDLNQVRTLLKEFKGTLAFTTAITPAGDWSGVTTQPSSFTNLLTLGGTGTRSDVNPWAYDYTDIDQLSGIFMAENDYTGRTNDLDASPYYGTLFADISQGDSLVKAIGTLASGLNDVTAQSALTTSGLALHEGDLTNPHVVTLTQASAAGGTALASQITITDVGDIFTSANTEDALQELWAMTQTDISSLSGIVATISGELDARIDAVELFPTSTSFRRAQFGIGLNPLSGVNLTHSAGVYPHVQVLNETFGVNPIVEPISQTSGVWIEHIDTNNVTVTNYTGTTFSGIAVVQW